MEETISFAGGSSIDDCVAAIMASPRVCSATFVYNAGVCACVMPTRFQEGCEINGELEFNSLQAYAIVQEADMAAGYVPIGAFAECTDIDEDTALFANTPATCAAVASANAMCSSIFQFKPKEMECLCLPNYVKCDVDNGDDGTILYATFDATATGTATGTSTSGQSGLAPIPYGYSGDAEDMFEPLDKTHEDQAAEPETYQFGVLLALGLASVAFGAGSMYVCQKFWRSREERAEVLLDDFSMHHTSEEIYVRN